MGGGYVNSTTLGGHAKGGQVCEHKKGGICTIHGAGAKLKWRPATKGTRGRGGARGKWDGQREYFYACDLGPTGNVMKQKKLSSFSFVKTTLLKTTRSEITEEGNLNNQESSTITGGKSDAV